MFFYAITYPDPDIDDHDSHLLTTADLTTDTYVYANSTCLPSVLQPIQDTPQLQTITDSGVSHHMNPHKEMFECIYYPLADKYGCTATVVLGDGTTTRPVK